ncbi:MAG: CsoS2 family carboxysome shell protein [Gammaproteobacteria bacterium]|nr:CsoS2 family carboxysome shell protein [Gammaproteobacteria bacterium]
MASQQQSGRAASMARRQMQVNGKSRSAAGSAPARQPKRQSAPAVNLAPAAAPQAAASAASGFVAPALPKPKRVQKSASRLRRESLASRGKQADRSSDRLRDNEMAMKRRSAAEAKAAKGDCDCGGPCCQEAEAKVAATAAPVSNLGVPAAKHVKVVKRRRVVSASDSGRMMSRARRAATSGRGKAGLEAHSKGNSSASLARQANPEISGRDLARVVRESRSKGGSRGNAAVAPVRTRRPRNAAEAKAISGTKVGHTEKLTGDEAGLCHTGVTGTSYMSAEVFDSFCQGEAPKAPLKVEATSTLSGSHVTSGGKVGGSTVMTGAEAGNCSGVTGSEYLGLEDFAQCGVTPVAAAAKVSTSLTQRGLTISGPKASRSDSVTGNHQGTCQAVTGTSYTGQEEFESFCAPEDQRKNRARTVMPQRAPGAGKDISGLQPGLSGNHLTGTATGACQAVSGTPYVASSEMSTICATSPASKGESDYPRAIADGAFSVVPSVVPDAVVPDAVAPTTVVSADSTTSVSSVTGSSFDGDSAITGAFSMGKGKITGTEQARFGARSNPVVKAEPKVEKAETASRVTGEGMETGLNITGNDWGRGEHVTGTEGRSAARRNPSRRGQMSAMPDVTAKREPQVVRESASVTGGSGGYQGTSAITLSGGARG